MEFKELLLTKLKEQAAGCDFITSEFRGELAITFDKKDIVKVCGILKNDPDLSFNLCEDVTAIDWAKEGQDIR